MTASLKMTIPFTRSVTATELAGLFCELDGEEQAEFFNSVAERVDSWGSSFCFQLQAVLDSHRLNAGGITIMRQIGEYGEDAKPLPPIDCCEVADD